MTLLTSSYLQDILDQPAALEATLQGFRQAPALGPFANELASRQYRQIILTGMGSSYYALHPLYLRLLNLGLCAQMIETSELVHHASALIESQNLIIAVSQSGQSAEILQLLARTGSEVSLIAVTNTPGSPLAQQSNATLITHAGTEYSVSCKTYLATLAALSWLGDGLLGEQRDEQYTKLASAAKLVAVYLERWQDHVADLVERLRPIRHLFLLGRGSSLAAVGTGGLIIKEAARFHSEGMSSAAFRHGPIEMLSPQIFALVYLGIPQTSMQNAQLVLDIRTAGGAAEAVRQGGSASPFELPSCDPVVLPLLEILPAQMCSLALAELQGIQPGQFRLAKKITTVE
jgi:glucosamine--fructose-6-phosphate aminotransferase (isomerizing)